MPFWNSPGWGDSGESDNFNFEGASLGVTDNEVAVSLTPRYSTFKKLEVAPSRSINAMAWVFNFASLIGLIAAIVSILLARYAFSTFEEIPGLLANDIYEFPPVFALIDSILAFILFTASFLLLTIFSYVLIREGKGRVLNEQIWVFFLLVGTVLYLNPNEASIRLRTDFIGIPDPENGYSHIDTFTCLRMVSFSVISILYLWMGSHSYRYLSRRISYKDWKFYLPKITIVLVYNIYKLCIFFRYRIVFSELPFATLLGFFSLYHTIGTWPGLGVTVVTILTGLELAILSMVLYDVVRTTAILNNAEYVKHRTKITGFRFFLHQHVIFYSVYVSIYLLLLFGLPNGPQVLLYNVHTQAGDRPGIGSYFDAQYSPFGLHLCILAYVAAEAYTNLPASVSLRRIWKKPSDLEGTEDICEPVVYRSREPPSFSGLDPDIRPNCFVMQTNIELFNLAWFVYYKGTAKETNLNVDFSKLQLKIKESFYDKETDTRALVAASGDRIVVAFKGTSSTQNLFTDIKVLYRSLSSIISWKESEQGLGFVDDTRGADVIPGKLFKKSKVHAGFADAYNSIREDLMATISRLVEAGRRPIYFTGHSLGGALATLCSLDVGLTLDMLSTRIVVTTFGSPRVGNKAFQEVYDEVIRMNWRVVAGGDIISRLPKIGYHHVGKKVILTAGGELFIDPNALDMLFWNSQPASLVHHRKSCYLLALKMWCDSRDNGYIPKFWPFPISDNDSRRFDTAFRKPNSGNNASFSVPSRKKRSADAERYKRWAKALDTLDSPIRNQGALLLWGRLTAAVLEEARKAAV